MSAPLCTPSPPVSGTRSLLPRSGARSRIGNWSRYLAAIVCGTAGFWLAGIACGAGTAPELTGEFAIETWRTEDGLPQNSVTAVLQTRDGYIWCGTYNGIAQFDGERFKLFDSSNTKGLVNSRVTCMYEDAQGDIWIGHDTGELTRYSEGRFQQVALGTNWRPATVAGIGTDENGRSMDSKSPWRGHAIEGFIGDRAAAVDGRGSGRHAGDDLRCQQPALCVAQRRGRADHSVGLPGGTLWQRFRAAVLLANGAVA